MARILHVEDEEDWIVLVSRVLAGHDVDPARSYRDALDLLQRPVQYDLALVDLNLRTNDDQLGGDVLDLLRSRYQGTRRIVVTGYPPVGPIGQNILKRYDVEEIIIKSQFTAPDLRMIVEDALRLPGAEISHALDLRKSELRQRLLDLQRSEGGLISKRVWEMEEFVRNATKLNAQSGQRARAELARARAVAASFGARCARFERRVDDLSSEAEAASAAEELERMEIFFNRASRGDQPSEDSDS